MDKISIWIENQLPSLASFGIKVLLSILAFYIGTRLIKWLLNFLRRSLGRTGIDTGGCTVYLFSGQNFAVLSVDFQHCDTVRSDRRVSGCSARVGWLDYRTWTSRWAFKFGRRCADLDFQTFFSGGLYH